MIKKFWFGAQFRLLGLLDHTFLKALEMIQNFFIPRVSKTQDYGKGYFQQDGATAHTAIAVQTYMTERFGEKFIDKKKCPPRSPDLHRCDFFCGVI